MANFAHHEPCPACGSSDAGARYSDNSFHCHKCHHNIKGDGSEVETQVETASDVKPWTVVQGDYRDLTDRKLKEETCRFWKYQTTMDFEGGPAHIMNIYDGSKLIAQKFRTPETKGLWRGQAKNPPFYGQWLWGKGKHLVITEGEIDAMSVSQVMDLKWPVVSLPNGTGSVRKAIENNYDWLDGFDNIVLMFDNDEPGREAVEQACELLPPGKVKVATLPEKDANDTLKQHGPGAITKAFWDAKPYRPDGIVSGEEFTLEDLMTEATKGFELRRTPKLQEMLFGLRKGELTLLTAGSGIGKSTWARELAYDLHQQDGLSIGNVFLEENNKKTAQGYIALHAGVSLGRLRANPALLTPEQWSKGLHEVVRNRMWFYNHFGSLEAKNLLNKLRYMAQVCKVDFIILDHISIVTSGVESSGEGERKDIDILMTKLRSLVEETGVGIIAIVHLKRAQGKTFNEGDQISLNDLRGSASLEQLSDNVIALERNQQAEGDTKRTSLIRVLKTREGDDTGEADLLTYNKETGRNELASPFEDAAEPKGGEPLTF
jgi:twinkle protein